jgi:hypothetical protein
MDEANIVGIVVILLVALLAFGLGRGFRNASHKN